MTKQRISKVMISIASLLAIIVCIGHMLSPEMFVEPLLLTSELNEQEKLLGHGNWNLFAIVTLSQFISFTLSALKPKFKYIGVYAGLLGIAVCLNLVYLGLTIHPQALAFPGLYVNGLIGLLGVFGSLSLTIEEAN